jgi:hypothetical protein
MQVAPSVAFRVHQGTLRRLAFQKLLNRIPAIGQQQRRKLHMGSATK